MVTVILFSVALVFYEPMNSSEKELDEPVAEETIEEETTKEETEEVSDESKDVSEKSEETEKTEGTSEETSEETDNIKTAETNTKTPGNSVAFKISAGESSYKVAENLYRAGLIDNPGEFNTYLEQNGYDNTIHVGTFNIPEGSTYDQIANTISK